MGWYDDWLLPRVTHLAMRNRGFADYRRRVVGQAEGEVLEIGIGSGLNLPFYGPDVRRVIAVEPSQAMVRMARRAAGKVVFPVELLDVPAEALPLPAASVDVAVSTWTLCTISDPVRALENVRRVLKPDGRFVFVEHGLAPDGGISRWQHRLTPLWARCAGGCHLDRDIPAIITAAGFTIRSLDTGYRDGRRSLAFMYEGTAG